MATLPVLPITEFEVTTSTNDTILEAGERGEPEGTTHLAWTQTRGRGRSNRSWWSPPGAGLWMSTLLRPAAPRARWSGISLLAGAAARDALESLGVRPVTLYWPNDLQVGRRKIGGILGEVRSRGEDAWIALGIGINIDFTLPAVRAAIPEEIRAIATSMAECGPPTTRDPRAIAAAIIERLWPLYQGFQRGEALPDLAGRALAHAGRGVEVRLPGHASWRGTVAGLGAGGELLVAPAQAAAAEVVAVTGGEVIYEDLP
jgi:BirA family biotin operon repressor/biotin-[acetyl-CoA-carboxylase] ligase